MTQFDLILIFLSAWGVTYGIVSGTTQGPLTNQKEIEQWKPDLQIGGSVPPQPIFGNTYYGELDGKTGPFGAYKAIRKFLGTSKSEILNEASYCRVCISLGVSIIFGAIGLIPFAVADMVLYAFAAHGAIIIYGNVIRVATFRPEYQIDGWRINDI